jgi:hypothetical protein
MFGKWFRGWKKAKPHTRNRARLQVEVLEDRTVPATLLGLTAAGRLITFDSASPTSVVRNVPISGLGAGESLVSLDSRPANGVIYGLSTSNLLYTASSRGTTRISESIRIPAPSSRRIHRWTTPRPIPTRMRIRQSSLSPMTAISRDRRRRPFSASIPGSTPW